jgi:ADP-dependent NAD(P)H-hydrate dehydratase / NAD(P)H-hydrate epimerase
MQLLVSGSQMQQLDGAAIRRLRIPGLLLMENAGRGVVERLVLHTGDPSGRKILVLCGKGNNGGDGFVIARHLLNRGARVHVGLLAPRSKTRGDARSNLDILLALARHRHPSLNIFAVTSPRSLRSAADAEIIVDAIFGTGFTGEVGSPLRRIVSWINARRAFVVAVDIPSGVDAGAGTVGNVAVRADLTVTMALGKIGHYVGDGRECSGTVDVVDIGIPAFLSGSLKGVVQRVGAADAAAVLPRRPLRVHKYDVGKVFILAGSRAFTGAPAMAAQSAMRTGAGAVVLGVPLSVYQVLARKLTEVILLPLPETTDGSVSMAGLEAICERVEWADAVALGPGLSMQDETVKLVRRLLPLIHRPLILDADGLTAAAGHLRLLRSRSSPTLITPHAGELSRLTGVAARDIETRRVEMACNAARELRATVLLKGAPTVTATHGGEVYLNSTGNPGMATIGSGDVLTGMAAALVAQGLEVSTAGWCAAFLHGLAGDRVAASLGERSVMAMDIAGAIPAALRECAR